MLASAVAVLATAALASCGSGSEPAADGTVTLSFMTGSDQSTVDTSKALADAFMKADPTIKIDMEHQPGGSEGDNVVKTRLSTGEMTDVFWYNSGSLLQALNPAQTLVDLTGDPVLAQVQPDYLPVVSHDGKAYGVPATTMGGGGILYNRKVYERLGLEVPRTWADFMANNDTIKAAGVTPVISTFKDTWTSQIFVLADYHNVQAAVPGFAADYTAGKAKFATTPAATGGFQHLADVHAKGHLNKGFGSATLDQGLKMLVEGEGAHYAMLSQLLPPLLETYPQTATDVGYFGIPGDDPALRRRHRLGARRPLHRQDHRAPGRGQEVPGLRRLPGGHRSRDRRRPAVRTVPDQGVEAAGGRHPGGQGPPGLHRPGRHDARAGVPVAHQGPVAGADHRRRRLGADAARRGRRPVRQGRGEAGQATGAGRVVTEQRAGLRAGPGGPPTRRRSPYPYALYLLSRRRLPGDLPGADGDGVLLRADPVDAVRQRVRRPGQLPRLPLRAEPARRLPEHDRLRRGHQRAEGGARPAAGRAAHVQAAAARLPARGGVLPGPGLHRGGRHHLQRAAPPGHRPGEQGPRAGRASTAPTGSATPRPRCCRSRWSTSGRAWAWPPSSTSPGSCRSRATTTRRSRSTGGRRLAPVPARDAAAVLARHLLGDHPVVHRRAAVVRPHLDDDAGRSRLHQRRHRLDHLQAVSGGLLRPVDRSATCCCSSSSPPSSSRSPTSWARGRSPYEDLQEVRRRHDRAGPGYRDLPGAVLVHADDRGQGPGAGRRSGLRLAGRLAGGGQPRRGRPGT
ncbi:extracellular solute-binding protein [Nonomuraea ferruginea]